MPYYLQLLSNLRPITRNYADRSGICQNAELFQTNKLVTKFESVAAILAAFTNGALWLCSPCCQGASVHNLFNPNFTLNSTEFPAYGQFGFEFDGIRQFFNTGFIPSVHAGTDNITLFIRSRTSGLDGGIDIGCSNGASKQTWFRIRGASDISRFAYTNSTFCDATVTNAVATFAASAIASNNRFIMKGQSVLVTNTSAHGNTACDVQMALGCRNNNGTKDLFSERTINTAGATTIGLDPTNCALVNSWIDEFNAGVIIGGR